MLSHIALCIPAAAPVAPAPGTACPGWDAAGPPKSAGARRDGV